LEKLRISDWILKSPVLENKLLYSKHFSANQWKLLNHLRKYMVFNQYPTAMATAYTPLWQF